MPPDFALVPPRSTAGQQILDLLIGVRIPGGQPKTPMSGLQAEALGRPILLDEMQSRAMLFLHLF